MEDVVKGAVGEMRKYYSRKIVDVLVKVTRQSLDALRKRFSVECEVILSNCDSFTDFSLFRSS